MSAARARMLVSLLVVAGLPALFWAAVAALLADTLMIEVSGLALGALATSIFLFLAAVCAGMIMKDDEHVPDAAGRVVTPPSHSVAADTHAPAR